MEEEMATLERELQLKKLRLAKTGASASEAENKPTLAAKPKQTEKPDLSDDFQKVARRRMVPGDRKSQESASGTFTLTHIDMHDYK